MIIYRNSPPKFEEIVTHVLPSVIGIAVGLDETGKPNIIGTGFAVEHSEFYVTCWHVAKVYAELTQLEDGKDHTLRLALWDASKGTYHWEEIQKGTLMSNREEDHDIFIFRVPGIAVPPLHVHENNAWGHGTEVGVIGFPMGNDLQGKVIRPYVIKTIVSSALELPINEDRTSPRLAIGTALAGGFSGGPVFDSKSGVVLGMVNSKIMENDELFSSWPAGISLATGPKLIHTALNKHIEDTTRRIREALWPRTPTSN